MADPAIFDILLIDEKILRPATEPASLPEDMHAHRMLQVDANRLVLARKGSNDIWIYNRASARKKMRLSSS